MFCPERSVWGFTHRELTAVTQIKRLEWDKVNKEIGKKEFRCVELRKAEFIPRNGEENQSKNLEPDSLTQARPEF
jgi:hypothetical protein